MIRVDLYSKPECSLCHKAMRQLEEVRRHIPFELKEHLLSEGSTMEELHREDIPVIYINGEFFSRYGVDEPALIRRLTDLLEEAGK